MKKCWGFILLFAWWAPSLTWAASVLDYLAALQSKTLPKQHLDVKVRPSSDHWNRLRAAYQGFNKERTAPLRMSLDGGDYQLIDTTLLNGEPILIIRNFQGQEFILRSHPWIRFEQVAKDISLELGLPTLPSAIQKSVKIHLSSLRPEKLRVWLRSAPRRLKWKHLVESSTETSILTQWVMIEPRAHLELYRSIYHSSRASKDASSISKQVLFASFLQCESLSVERDFLRRDSSLFLTDLRWCLGHSRFSSTPNSFLAEWLGVAARRPTLFSEAIYFDPQFKQKLAKVSPEDLGNFLRMLDQLSKFRLQQIFVQNGFSADLGQLYALKLLARRASVKRLFALEDDEWEKELRSFSRPPFIVRGELRESDPEAGLDLTQTALNYFLSDLAEAVQGHLETTIQHLLATLPFMGVELFEVGPGHLAPGLLFRIQRTVLRNSEAKRIEDLYLVRDELDLGLTLGLGISKRLGVSVWANAGPGYLRKAVRVHFAQSPSEAKESYWGIPWRLLFEMEYTHLQPGELFAVESGWMGMGIIGSTFLSGFVVRPAAYLMTSFEKLTGVQLFRVDSNRSVVVTSDDRRFQLQSKGFWRLYNRYIRVPFFSLASLWGNESNRIFFLDPSNSLQATRWDSIQEAYHGLLWTGDFSELNKYIDPIEEKVDYFSWVRLINIYLFSSQLEVYSAEVQSDEQFYYVVGSRNQTGQSADADQSSCEIIGLIEEEHDQKIRDSLLEIECVIHVQTASSRRLRQILQDFENDFTFESNFRDPPLKESDEESSFQLQIRWGFQHADLKSLISPDDWPDLSNEVSYYEFPIEAFDEQLIEHYWRHSLGIRKDQSFRDNLRTLVAHLRKDILKGDLIRALVKRAPPSIFEMHLESALLSILDNPYQVIQIGEAPETPLWDYHERRRKLGYRFMTNIH